jgi:hypothetical protein
MPTFASINFRSRTKRAPALDLTQQLDSQNLCSSQLATLAAFMAFSTVVQTSKCRSERKGLARLTWGVIRLGGGSNQVLLFSVSAYSDVDSRN